VIFVSGHLGNWELGGAYMAARGLPMDVVARTHGEPLFDRYLTSTRQRIGMTVIHDEKRCAACRGRCAAGAPWHFWSIRAVGLASVVPFFGRFAKRPGARQFALRLGAPVYSVWRYDSRPGDFSWLPADRRDGHRRSEADVDRIVADLRSSSSGGSGAGAVFLAPSALEAPASGHAA
jgi:KDO2-lipid IV(A) lauroyltransferase